MRSNILGTELASQEGFGFNPVRVLLSGRRLLYHPSCFWKWRMSVYILNIPEYIVYVIVNVLSCLLHPVPCGVNGSKYTFYQGLMIFLIQDIHDFCYTSIHLLCVQVPLMFSYICFQYIKKKNI